MALKKINITWKKRNIRQLASLSANQSANPIKQIGNFVRRAMLVQK
jgi:hypothetical protein